MTLTACGSSSGEATTAADAAKQTYPVTVSNSGKSVTIPSKPEKIVSLSPTATENLFAIDAGAQVIAVDDQSTYPTTAPKTTLSGFKPNVEAILGYQPDLVVAQYDTGGMVAALEQAKVPVLLQPSANTLEDAYRQIAELGSATDHAAKSADVVASIKSTIDKAVESSGPAAKGKTYYHEVDSTYFSATSKTFIGQIYSLFGMTNIADGVASADNQYPQLSSEYIVKSNPTYIFLADTKCCTQSAQTVAARPGWSGMTAVTGKHVIALDDDIASRWGPRVTDLVTAVGAAVSGK